MTTNGFKFTIEHTDGKARKGVIETTRGPIPTPAFMPVGTRGSVKTLDPTEVRDTGASILLGNTYHLMLRPGPDIIERAGGLSPFMAWHGPTLTDSGGFQVFSLADRVKITDEGVIFASHIDGKREHLTPERAIAIQTALGSNIAMVLDECPPGTGSKDDIAKAMERTTLWAKRQEGLKRAEGQALFGIVQGGTHVDLRREHLGQISELDFDGVALGGLSVGEPVPEMYNVLREMAHEMPEKRPRYLMGVGTPDDLLEAIEQGIDMFDCVMPTRNARNGQAFVHGGKLNIKQARFAEDSLPLEPGCTCACCQRFERRYLRHLFLVGELLVLRLITIHNLHHWGSLTAAAREAIANGRYAEFKKSWHEPLDPSQPPLD